MRTSQTAWCFLLCWCLPAVFRSRADTSPVLTGDARDSRDATATQDDVAVLTFGVLQLSDTLGRVKDTTEARVQAFTGPLGTHQAWLALLGEEAGRAADAQQRAKDSLQQLEVQMLGQQSQNDVAREALARVQLEDQELWTRVGEVEEYLDPALPPRIPQLQEKATEHSDILRMLQIFTQDQQNRLDTQTHQLSRLELTVAQAVPETPAA